MADRSLEIEDEIEVLDERIERCRRAILLSRAAAWIGGGILALVSTILGSLRTPQIFFGALTAVLGGLIWLGASQSSLKDLEAERAALDAERDRLFQAVAIKNGWADLTPTIH